MSIRDIHINPNYVTKRRSRAKLIVIEGGLPANAVRLTHSLSVRLTPPFEDTSHVEVVDAQSIFLKRLEDIFHGLPNHLRYMAPLSGSIDRVDVATCPQTAHPMACQYVLTATLGEQNIIVDSVAGLVEAWTHANALLSMVEHALQPAGWELENRSYLLSASKTPKPWLVRACVEQNITLVFEMPSGTDGAAPQPTHDRVT